MQYQPEVLILLNSLGLKHLVCQKETEHIMAAFFHEQDADDCFADPPLTWFEPK